MDTIETGQSKRAETVRALAASLFGDARDTAAFLNTPHPELAGRTPADMLRSEEGAAKVERILNALAHGLPV